MLEALIEKGLQISILLEEGSHCRQMGEETPAFFSCIRTKNFTFSDNGQNVEDTLQSIESSWVIVLVCSCFLVLIMLSLGLLFSYHLHRVREIQTKEALERRACRQAVQALSKVEVLQVKEELSLGQCSVCLEKMVSGEEVRCLPCSHTFHRRCIDAWLLGRGKCPLCNLDIVKHFGKENLIGVDQDEADFV